MVSQGIRTIPLAVDDQAVRTILFFPMYTHQIDELVFDTLDEFLFVRRYRLTFMKPHAES